MKIVVIESPYAYAAPNWFRRWQNRRYARQCLKDSLKRGEAPMAAHLLYTQVLDDTDALERAQGIRAGAAFIKHASLVAVYMDRGLSPGMEFAIRHAKLMGTPVEERRLSNGVDSRTETEA